MAKPGSFIQIINVTTDNKNRAASEIRKIFEVSDGKLGATGCVAEP